VNKAKSALDLAQIRTTRARDLFEGKGGPLKDTSKQAKSDPGAERYALVANAAGGGGANKLRISDFSRRPSWPFRKKRSINPRYHIFSPMQARSVRARSARPST